MHMHVFTRGILQSVVVDEKHANMLKRELFAPLGITSALEKVLMIMGGLLILLAVAILYLRHTKSQSRVSVVVTFTARVSFAICII